MKIVFLDIDGVLCTYRAFFAQGRVPVNGVMGCLDREAVGLLDALTCSPLEDVKIVLTSTWRLTNHPIGQGDRDKVEAHLRLYQWRGSFHPDWRTGDLGGESHRGEEIQGWLDNHSGIESYVILDDKEMTDPNSVQTFYAEGLSWAAFRHAAKILHNITVEPAS